MSLHSYRQSLDLTGYQFSALIMAAIRRAGTGNARILQNAFPEIHAELSERYDARGRILPQEMEQS